MFRYDSHEIQEQPEKTAVCQIAKRKESETLRQKQLHRELTLGR